MTSAELLPAAVLRRKAVVYIRQSTQAQVQTNQRSGGDPPLSQHEKDQLFEQFKRWASERPELRRTLEER
jgi:DNA invertase Pin-like site-specific DNA recombinase